METLESRKTFIRGRIWPAYVLIVFFATLFTLGLLWGGFGKVFTNAAIVCLDCIGLI